MPRPNYGHAMKFVYVVQNSELTFVKGQGLFELSLITSVTI